MKQVARYLTILTASLAVAAFAQSNSGTTGGTTGGSTSGNASGSTSGTAGNQTGGKAGSQTGGQTGTQPSGQTGGTGTGNSGNTGAGNNANQNFNVPMPDLKSADASFVTVASDDNMAEILMARIVGQKSTNNAVKQAAQQLATDHRKAEQELRTAANGVGGTNLDDNTDITHQLTAMQLSKLTGAKFDVAFVEDQIQDHKTAISLMGTYSEVGSNAKLKAWAAKQIPVLQKHLALMEKLYPQVAAAVKQESKGGASGTGTSGSGGTSGKTGSGTGTAGGGTGTGTTGGTGGKTGTGTGGTGGTGTGTGGTGTGGTGTGTGGTGGTGTGGTGTGTGGTGTGTGGTGGGTGTGTGGTGGSGTGTGAGTGNTGGGTGTGGK